MGETRDRAMALAALVEAFAVKDMTPVRVRAYENALQDVPIALLNAAVRRAISSRTFFPKVAELRADAEAERRALIDAHPYDGCIDCEHSKGWTALLVDGVERVTRCGCWTRHQAKLATLGVSAQPLALPAATPRDLARVGESE